MKEKEVILIVDDVASNIQTLAAILKDDYQVKVAISGARALEIVIEDPIPDLILLDAEMPQMNGYEVLQRLKDMKQTQNIPVIFVTGNTTTDEEEKGLRLGAVDYITKPVRPTIVKARIKTHIMLKRQSDELLESKVKEEVQKNQAQNMQMFHQSRLAQMGEMLSMIAHQWRQPLAAIAATSIDMQLKIELETFDLNKESERVSCISYFTKGLGKIDMFTNSLSTTIDDFRNFQNPNKKLSSGTICDTIESALKIIKPMLESQNIIIEEKYDEPKEIEFFANEMAQVLLNILKNALDNFKEKASLNPKIVIKSKNMLSGVVIEICDNGGGIPDAIIDKIFDPYFSTKNEKNGTGLGLYMSKIIIEDHHSGKLKVLNSDEGVCFSIELKDKIIDNRDGI